MKRLHHPLHRWPVGMSQGEIRAAKLLYALERMANSHGHMGQILGYPRCCVAEFMASHRRDPSPAWHGSGFMPCPACRERDPRELWREIMARRRANGVRLVLRRPVTP